MTVTIIKLPTIKPVELKNSARARLVSKLLGEEVAEPFNPPKIEKKFGVSSTSYRSIYRRGQDSGPTKTN